MRLSTSLWEVGGSVARQSNVRSLTVWYNAHSLTAQSRSVFMLLLLLRELVPPPRLYVGGNVLSDQHALRECLLEGRHRQGLALDLRGLAQVHCQPFVITSC